MSELLNGFNNGRDTTEGIGGQKPIDSIANDATAGDRQLTIPVVTNRTCSNCHHCVINPSSENEHDQYKCFAREHITTISNINNYVCDKWTENSF